MTNKEAIKIIELAIAEVEWNYPIVYTVAFEKAIESLKIDIEYCEHNLEANPTDLPDTDRTVEVHYHCFDDYEDDLDENETLHIAHSCYHKVYSPFNNKGWMEWSSPFPYFSQHYVIDAWRDIRPFDGVMERQK